MLTRTLTLLLKKPKNTGKITFFNHSNSKISSGEGKKENDKSSLNLTDSFKFVDKSDDNRDDKKVEKSIKFHSFPNSSIKYSNNNTLNNLFLNERTTMTDNTTIKKTEGVNYLEEFPAVFNFPKIEEEILAYWKRIDAFKQSLERSKGKEVYTFYDGPPFATGLPHYGHILAGTIKDIVCRYAHQTNHHVERRFGWDCHGLPIEFEIEKELGIKSSKDVLALGIDKYNAECRKIVMRYATEWDRIVNRAGRWIDFKDDYKTMNIGFMETVWWVFSELWKKNLVYRGFKVMPFSTGCTTPLSNFEANMNYKDVSDPAVTVMFPLVRDPTVNLLAWTTTPWTLPSNLALCVNASFDYLVAHDKHSGKRFVFAESRLGEIYKHHEKSPEKPFTIEKRVKGEELVGERYVPLFDYFANVDENYFKVVSDDYVTGGDGTGIVHSAPGFGEDDYRVCLKNGIVKKGETVCPVEENGLFTAEVKDYAGRYIKECDEEIIAEIKRKGRLLQKASVVHSYPFCWRSETPLIYKAVNTWFIRVEEFRDTLVAASAETNWVPEYVKTKRFTNWLEDAKDWNIARNRYWGTPIPIWVSEDYEERVCVGSIEELERLSGTKGLSDLHREFIDKITIPSSRPGNNNPPLRRIGEVFDCWFESGSMPYGQSHYPFENKEKFENNFPADFIAEGLDQTRGWFYTLLILSTALFNKPPYKNLIVNGMVLAADGKKMSKRLKNYPEVEHILNDIGADALRLCLINSPVVRAEPLRFREESVRDIIKDVFLPLFNACKFFTSNANRFISEGNELAYEHQSSNDMDRWIASLSQTLVNFVHSEMAGYRLYTVVPKVLEFVDLLTNWYVRMNRRRMKGQLGQGEMKDSLCTLFRVLFTVTRILAPFCPFAAEFIFQRIRPCLPAEFKAEDSIHYVMVPEVKGMTREEDRIEQAMARMVKVIELVRVLRDRVGIPMKMPLSSVIVLHPEPEFISDMEATSGYISSEINAFDLSFSSEESEYVVTKLDANMASIGKKYKKDGKEIKKALTEASIEQINSFLTHGKLTVLDGKAELTAEDVKIIRTFRPGIDNYESNSDGRVVVLIDKRKDDTLIDSWRAREFTNRVMLLRKSAKMQPSDRVDILCVTKDEDLKNSINSRSAQIKESCKDVWTFVKEIDLNDNGQLLTKIDTAIDEIEITIAFTKPKQSQ